ncbi:winged helix-turn-helix domain-containing protein [Glutamicibacter ardleyensis]
MAEQSKLSHVAVARATGISPATVTQRLRRYLS